MTGAQHAPSGAAGAAGEAGAAREGSGAVARLDLVIPVHNEVRVLEASVTRLLEAARSWSGFEWRVVIVDNASRDGTDAVGRELAQRHANVVYHRLEVKGKGHAIRWAWSHTDSEYSLFMDADLSTDLGAVPEAVEQLRGGADVVIGTRFHPRASVTRSFKRDFISNGYRLLLKSVFWSRGFPDAQCGFKGVRVGRVRPLLPLVVNDRYFFDTELLLLAERLDLTVRSIPVNWVERRASGVNIPRSVLEFLAGLARMRFTLGSVARRGRELLGTPSGPSPADGASTSAPSRRSKWIAAAILLCGLLVRLAVTPSYGYLGRDADLIEHKQVLHRAISRGVHEIYTSNARNDPALNEGKWNGGFFFNYPPLIVYVRYLPALIYRLAEPAAFHLWDSELGIAQMRQTDLTERLARSRGFTVAIKLPGVVADVLLTWLLWVFVTRRAGPKWGLAAAALYAFNPGIIFDSAHWGQPDSVWVLLVALSLFLAHRGRVELSWVAYALAALCKPQAAAYALLIVFLGVAHATWRRVAAASVAALAAIAIVFLPFLLHGTFVPAVQAIATSTFGGEPFVSCNAANFWWLWTGGRGYQVGDATSLLGPLTPRRLGMIVFLVVNAAIFARLARRRCGADRLFLAAALAGMTFFTFATELHENHMMAVLPLLLFAVSVDRRLWTLLAALSVTFLGNMVLADPPAYRALSRVLGFKRIDVHGPSLVLAAVNVAACAVLAWIFWTRTASDADRPKAA